MRRNQVGVAIVRFASLERRMRNFEPLSELLFHGHF